MLGGDWRAGRSVDPTGACSVPGGRPLTELLPETDLVSKPSAVACHRAAEALFATAAEKPLPRKGPESFPSWTSPVRPRSPALSKGPDSSGLCLLVLPRGAGAAAISQYRKRREDADLNIEKYGICESARQTVATAFGTGPGASQEVCRRHYDVVDGGLARIRVATALRWEAR